MDLACEGLATIIGPTLASVISCRVPATPLPARGGVAYAAVHETNGQVCAEGHANAADGMPPVSRIINMHTGVSGGGGGARSCFGRLCVFLGGPVRPDKHRPRRIYCLNISYEARRTETKDGGVGDEKKLPVM